jgi:MGT family glycosyltransferase
VNPGLPIASELVSRGHHVSWYTGSGFRASVESVGARHVPVERGIDPAGDIDGFLNEHFPEREHLRGLAAVKFDLRLFYDGAIGEFQDLQTFLKTGPVDAIFSDPATLGALFLAERDEIPCAVFGMTIPLIRSRDTPPPALGLAPGSSALARLRNRALDALMSSLLLRDVTRYADGVRRQLGLPEAGRSFLEEPIATGRLWLQATTPDFEYPRRDLPDHFRFIGPLLPKPPDRFEPPSWWEELDGGRPVVLVTQGTARGNPDELLVPTLRALEGQDLLVVATTGGSDAVSALGGRVPRNARIEPFLSYHHLLPKADLMITNGGYGGVHFALSYGVPLIGAAGPRTRGTSAPESRGPVPASVSAPTARSLRGSDAPSRPFSAMEGSESGPGRSARDSAPSTRPERRPICSKAWSGARASKVTATGLE